MRAPVTILFGAALLVAGCSKLQPRVPGADEHAASSKRAEMRRLQQACGSAASYARLKALTFEQAAAIGHAPPRLLDAISAGSVVRMESPVVKSRDETLNVTVCSGHFVLELPPGAENAFDGHRRLEADVEYSAQEAADGSGLVYQIRGAEPMIYRLAALQLKPGSAFPAQPPVATMAAQPAMPAAPMAPPPPLSPSPPVARAIPAAPPPKSVPNRAAPARPLPPAATPPARPAPIRATARPSFNCAAARSQVERLICTDAGLAARDRAMSSLFYDALSDADPDQRAALRETRGRFLAFRDRCGSTGCVADAYTDRIAEIRDIMAGR